MMQSLQLLPESKSKDNCSVLSRLCLSEQRLPSNILMHLTFKCNLEPAFSKLLSHCLFPTRRNWEAVLLSKAPGKFLRVALTAHRAIHHFSKHPRRAPDDLHAPDKLWCLSWCYHFSSQIPTLSERGFFSPHPFFNDEQLLDRLYCSCQLKRYRCVFLKTSNSPPQLVGLATEK